MVKKAEAWLFLLVSDVEAHAVGPVMGYLDGKTTTDALGRLWCSNSDAAVAVEKAEAAWQDELRSKSEYQAYLQDRGVRRQELLQKVRKDSGGGRTPSEDAVVRQRQIVALEEFDRESPELDYYRWRDSRSAMAGAR